MDNLHDAFIEATVTCGTLHHQRCPADDVHPKVTPLAQGGASSKMLRMNRTSAYDLRSDSRLSLTYPLTATVGLLVDIIKSDKIKTNSAGALVMSYS